MSQRESIFLVGPMGAGKTTVGRALAKIRGMDFIDADHALEDWLGVDIATIFDKEGEAGFRQREAQMIDQLTQRPGIVLGTGGGVVLNADNRRHLGARGFVVYLHTPVEVQWRRVRHSKHRPLLQTQNPKARLEALLRERDPLYRKVADMVVKSRHQSARALAGRIDQQLDNL